MDLREFFKAEDVLIPAIRIAVIILLAFVVHFLVKRILRKVGDRVKRQVRDNEVGSRTVTLVGTTSSLVKYAIFFIAVMMSLREAGFNLAPLIAGAGIAGLAIGFGAQTLVKDVVSGFFILLDDQYGLDDIVKINNVVGTVENVGLRLTKIRDVQGNLHFFPNGSVSSVNIYPKDGVTYQVNIPATSGKSNDVRKFVETAFSDFNSEFDVFTCKPILLGEKQLSSYSDIVIFELKANPLKANIVSEKLCARISGSLQRSEFSIPEGTEITLVAAVE